MNIVKRILFYIISRAMNYNISVTRTHLNLTFGKRNIEITFKFLSCIKFVSGWHKLLKSIFL